MRTTINLATRPYLELRPLLRRLRLGMALLALLAIGLGVAQHVVGARAAAEQQLLTAERNRTLNLQQEKTNNEARMRQPQNAAVLERSRFLNELFARKSFSWTAVMMDLEEVLPTGVVVTSIEPQIASDGAVTIKLRVAGERDRTVQLVRNLEGSRRFLSPRLTGEAAQAVDKTRNANLALNAPPPGVEFEILAGYNPLPLGTRRGKRVVETDAGPATAVHRRQPMTTPHPSNAMAQRDARVPAPRPPALPKHTLNPLSPPKGGVR
jgi:type IV pilus assembly protein PilN